MSQPVLDVVIGSTRPGRVGKPVADWFVAKAQEHGTFEVVTVDLAELDLPFFNEAKHPRLGQYEHDHTKQWSAVAARADAFVFVTPEYNHGFTAPMKNALDYLNAEWAFKPAALVSYGGVAAGTRAAQMLEPVLTVLKMHVLAEAVNIPFVGEKIGPDGALQANEIMDSAAVAVLDRLAQLSAQLAPLRS